jgi:predicted Fe-S protein YdhL (DUF1289 family)
MTNEYAQIRHEAKLANEWAAKLIAERPQPKPVKQPKAKHGPVPKEVRMLGVKTFNLERAKLAAEKYGYELEAWQALSRVERQRVVNKARRKALPTDHPKPKQNFERAKLAAAKHGFTVEAWVAMTNSERQTIVVKAARRERV